MVYSSGHEEEAIAKINDPSLLFGKGDTMYVLMNRDGISGSPFPFAGGMTMIFGYQYANVKYGAQLAMKYGNILLYRQLYNGTWGAWSNLIK